MQIRRAKGFTLLELLIALFVFSILSVLMTNALHNMINAQSGTEKNAQRLRNMQMTLLLMSRDIEQTVNRPIINPSGREDAALQGTSTSIVFTHAGFANPMNNVLHSALERTAYSLDKANLVRSTWRVLDLAPKSIPHTRELLSNLTSLHFQYLDMKGRFYDEWPIKDEVIQPLPVAIKMTLNIAQWGELSQLYIIPVQRKPDAPKPETPPIEKS